MSQHVTPLHTLAWKLNRYWEALVAISEAADNDDLQGKLDNFSKLHRELKEPRTASVRDSKRDLAAPSLEWLVRVAHQSTESNRKIVWDAARIITACWFFQPVGHERFYHNPDGGRINRDWQATWEEQQQLAQSLKECESRLLDLAAELGALVGADSPDWPKAVAARPPEPQAQPKDAGEPVASASRSGFLGGSELAEALGVHPSRREAFFKQLERDRISLGDENWQEVSNRRANTPRYQYRADSPKLRELANNYKEPKPA